MRRSRASPKVCDHIVETLKVQHSLTARWLIHYPRDFSSAPVMKHRGIGQFVDKNYPVGLSLK